MVIKQRQYRSECAKPASSESAGPVVRRPPPFRLSGSEDEGSDPASLDDDGEENCTSRPCLASTDTEVGHLDGFSSSIQLLALSDKKVLTAPIFLNVGNSGTKRDTTKSLRSN